jgi:predicted nucleic acid-binding protein
VGTRVLIDSNIVIDVLAGVPRALAEVRKHRDRAISVITWIEVTAGLTEEEQRLREFVSANFPVIALTPEIAEESAFLRRTSRLKLPDAVILATAHKQDRVLVTRNTRDFSPGRFVRIPYTL